MINLFMKRTEKKNKMETELIAKYDSRKSFYGKAKVTHVGQFLELKSYDTIAVYYNMLTNELKVMGRFSATTARHINEFLQQLGFNKITKAEMEAGYEK